MAQQTVSRAIDDRQRERLLKMLVAATFIIFFQAYMVAPIIPTLSKVFGTSVETVRLIVPAYLIPYGIATLAYGLLADRLGIHRVMFASLAALRGAHDDDRDGAIRRTARAVADADRDRRKRRRSAGIGARGSAVFLRTAGPTGVGVALLGCGLPGFLFGPLIGRAADRWGRARLIPMGLTLSAVASSVLMLGFPIVLAPAVAMLLSLGYDMTQPLFAGIVTSLGGQRAGQAMGLNVFTLIVGFGLGSLIFGALLRFGFGTALGLFTLVELSAALLSFALFRSEVPSRAAST